MTQSEVMVELQLGCPECPKVSHSLQAWFCSTVHGEGDRLPAVLVLAGIPSQMAFRDGQSALLSPRICRMLQSTITRSISQLQKLCTIFPQ